MIPGPSGDQGCPDEHSCCSKSITGSCFTCFKASTHLKLYLNPRNLVSIDEDVFQDPYLFVIYVWF